MRYPRRNNSRSSTSNRSCTSNSIVNTTLTNVSENRDRDDEDEGDDDQAHVEGLQFLAERDMKSLHRHIPALGRSDVQNSAMRQHYYPEGGWGWVVVACTFLSNLLTTGLLLSGGMLGVEMLSMFPGVTSDQVTWVTVSAWSVSLLTAPIIVHVCRDHSLHQVFISYGLLFGVSCAAVRETSSMMVGQYFKMRRDLAEMWSLSGVGMGILVFSLLYFQAIGSLKWRLGLQAIQSVIILAFFLGLFFRPASIYHPQRDAISHIKCQKEKVKGVNSKEKLKQKKKPQLFNFAFFKHRRVRLFIISLSVGSLGIYTPLFYLVHHQWEEGGERMTEHLSLLQIWLGLATSAGTLVAGYLTMAQSRHFYMTSRLVLQVSVAGCALAMFSLYCVSGYYGYVLSIIVYGLCLGSFLYTSKMFLYNSVKAKDFGHVWSMVMASQSMSALGGIMITGYINTSYSKTGYWFSILSTILSTCILGLIEMENDEGLLHTVQSSQTSQQATSNIMQAENTGKRNTVLCFDPEISMNFNSKVDKYFCDDPGGDLNGNFNKLRQGDLQTLSDRKLSQSDPLLLNSCHGMSHVARGQANTCHNLWEYQIIQPEQLLRRQTTWHHSASHNQPSQERIVQILEEDEDNLLVDQITSTV